MILLPAPAGVHSGCAGAAAPMGAISQDELHRVTDGKLPIKVLNLVYSCYGGSQDDIDFFGVFAKM